jgi:uroporphyrin-III C-methyltransferase
MTDPETSDPIEPASQTGGSEAPVEKPPGDDAARAESTAPKDARARRGGATVLLWLVVLTAFVLLGLEWYDTRTRIAKLRDEAAARISETSAEVRRELDATRELRETARELQSRVDAIETKQSETRSREAALDSLYQELSRGRDEWTLSEVEQTLQIASQQLYLAGNVSSALAALQEIDARLGRADRVELAPLRKSIENDIDRLKAVPNLDVPGLTLRLDDVIDSVDAMPLRSEEQKTATETSSAPPARSWWERVAASAWGEVKGLVRIQRIDVNDSRLLAPEQAYFLRENLKLRLLHARVALLQRNETIFRGDIKQARDMIQRYFDTEAKSVASAVDALAKLDSAALQVELPSLSDSLNMVRRLRQPRDS